MTTKQPQKDVERIWKGHNQWIYRELPDRLAYASRTGYWVLDRSRRQPGPLEMIWKTSSIFLRLSSQQLLTWCTKKLKQYSIKIILRKKITFQDILLSRMCSTTWTPPLYTAPIWRLRSRSASCGRSHCMNLEPQDKADKNGRTALMEVFGWWPSYSFEIPDLILLPFLRSDQ